MVDYMFAESIFAHNKEDVIGDMLEMDDELTLEEITDSMVWEHIYFSGNWERD